MPTGRWVVDGAQAGLEPVRRRQETSHSPGQRSNGRSAVTTESSRQLRVPPLHFAIYVTRVPTLATKDLKWLTVWGNLNAQDEVQIEATILMEERTHVLQ